MSFLSFRCECGTLVYTVYGNNTDFEYKVKDHFKTFHHKKMLEYKKKFEGVQGYNCQCGQVLKTNNRSYIEKHEHTKMHKKILISMADETMDKVQEYDE